MKFLLFLFFTVSSSLAFSQKSYSGFGKFPVDPGSGSVIFDTIMTARDPKAEVHKKVLDYIGTAMPSLPESSVTKDPSTGMISTEATLGFGYSRLYVTQEKKKTSQTTQPVTDKIIFRLQVSASDNKARVVIKDIRLADTSSSTGTEVVNLAAFNATLQKAASEQLTDQVEAKNNFAKYEAMYAVLKSFIDGLNEKLMFKPMQ